MIAYDVLQGLYEGRTQTRVGASWMRARWRVRVVKGAEMAQVMRETEEAAASVMGQMRWPGPGGRVRLISSRH